MTYSELYAFRIKQLCLENGITINRLAVLAGLKHKIATVFEMTLSEFLDYPELNEYSIDDEEDE